jgi:hypothetical protein
MSLPNLAVEAWRIAGVPRCEESTMSFELILPFLRPIESLLLDDIERYPSGRAVREVLRMIGYDRDAKRFLVEPVFEVQHAA